MKKQSFIRVLNQLLSLTIVLLMITIPGCKKEDLGKCTIKKSDGNIVIEDISLEECQLEFGETVGSSGWSWEPNN